MVIGVTGKYGAGKDAVTRILVSKGFTEINVDAIGHRALEENKKAVTASFGGVILDRTGMIDRRALGAIVFKNPEKRILLESLVHPRMRELVAERIDGAWGHSVINAALLFPMGLDSMIDALFIVRAPLFIRFLRANRRDRIGPAALLRRLFSQKKIIPQQARRAVDTYCIDNTGSLRRLTARVEKILQTVMKKAGKEGIS